MHILCIPGAQRRQGRPVCILGEALCYRMSRFEETTRRKHSNTAGTSPPRGNVMLKNVEIRRDTKPRKHNNIARTSRPGSRPLQIRIPAACK